MFVNIGLAISCRPSNTLASSNLLPSIKYISSHYLWFNVIYLIQNPQFTSAPWSNTSENISSILSKPSTSSTTFYEAL